MSHTTTKARLARTGGRLNKDRSFLTSLDILYSLFYRRMTVIYKIKKILYIFIVYLVMHFNIIYLYQTGNKRDLFQNSF